MSMYTVIGPDGKERGPIAAGQIKDWIAHEGFSSDSMIKSNETGEWKRVREIPELCVGSKPPSATSDLATGSQSNDIIKYMLKGMDGKEYGPMTGEEIKDSLDRKRLLPTTLARQVGETGLWQYLFEHPEIYDSSLQPHRPNQGLPTPPDWAPLQERLLGARFLKFLPDEWKKNPLIINGGGFVCFMLLLGVGVAIFGPANEKQGTPNSNAVAAVAPAAPAKSAAIAKSAAYQAGYDLGVKLGAYEHPELVGESEQAIISDRSQLERTGWAGAANDGYGGNLDYVQGFADAYADHGLVGGGRFTVSP